MENVFTKTGLIECNDEKLCKKLANFEKFDKKIERAVGYIKS